MGNQPSVEITGNTICHAFCCCDHDHLKLAWNSPQKFLMLYTISTILSILDYGLDMLVALLWFSQEHFWWFGILTTCAFLSNCLDCVFTSELNLPLYWLIPSFLGFAPPIWLYYAFYGGKLFKKKNKKQRRLIFFFYPLPPQNNN
jgi:hypothetical protein